MFIRVRTEELANLLVNVGVPMHGTSVDGKESINSYHLDTDAEYIYVKRLAMTHFIYLRARSKPASVSMSDAASITAELDRFRIEYDATLAVDELVGQRTYGDGSEIASLLSHLGDGTAALGEIMDSTAPYLLVADVRRKKLPAAEAKFAIRSVAERCLMMGEEDDMIRLKLKYGGKLLDMKDFREKSRDSGYTG